MQHSDPNFVVLETAACGYFDTRKLTKLVPLRVPNPVSPQRKQRSSES